MSGGALGGMLVRRLLPVHHLTKETEDVVRLAIGVIATMCALVVGLLLASAKGYRQMAHYGAETKEARDLLQRYTEIKIDAIWPREASHPVVPDTTARPFSRRALTFSSPAPGAVNSKARSALALATLDVLPLATTS